MGKLATVLGDFWRFATFMPLKGDVRADFRLYLLVGAVTTWIVGAGRWWDYAEAPWWLRVGITSLGYTIVLAAFIWIITLALRPARWSFANVLLMVMMTAAPGIIYAVPVERIFEGDIARLINFIFLAIVAIWRMALYKRFLNETAKLDGLAGYVAWLLPPTIIVAFVSVLGLLQAIARGMGGVREPPIPGEVPEQVIGVIALVSWVALPILLITFIVLAVHRWRAPRG